MHAIAQYFSREARREAASKSYTNQRSGLHCPLGIMLSVDTQHHGQWVDIPTPGPSRLCEVLMKNYSDTDVNTISRMDLYLAARDFIHDWDGCIIDPVDLAKVLGVVDLVDVQEEY